MRYELTWRNKYLTAEETTIEGMVVKLRAAADFIEELHKTGKVIIEDLEGIADDYVTFITYDAATAQKYGFLAEED